jgi:hypothetical protein
MRLENRKKGERATVRILYGLWKLSYVTPPRRIIKKADDAMMAVSSNLRFWWIYQRILIPFLRMTRMSVTLFWVYNTPLYLAEEGRGSSYQETP